MGSWHMKCISILWHFRADFSEKTWNIFAFDIIALHWKPTVFYDLYHRKTRISNLYVYCGGSFLGDFLEREISRFAQIITIKHCYVGCVLLEASIYHNKRGYAITLNHMDGEYDFQDILRKKQTRFINNMTSSNGIIFRVVGPLWEESTGHRWIPLTKASHAELWRFFMCPKTSDWTNNRVAGDLRLHWLIMTSL